MENFSITVERLCNSLQLNSKLQNLFMVGGVAPFEPGLSICQKAIGTLLARGTHYKWNRSEISIMEGNFLVTQKSVQTFRHGGASVFRMSEGGRPATGASLDLAANPVWGDPGVVQASGTTTLNLLDRNPMFKVGDTVFISGTGSSVDSTWNFDPDTSSSGWIDGHVLTAVPDDLTLVFSNSAADFASGAPGIRDLSFLESAWMTQIDTKVFPLPVAMAQAVDTLPVRQYMDGNQTRIAAIRDENNGVIHFRLSGPAPLQAQAVSVTYQRLPSVLTSPQSVISWPDAWYVCLEEVALYFAYKYIAGVSGPETTMQRQMATEAIAAAGGTADFEDQGSGFAPAFDLMG